MITSKHIEQLTQQITNVLPSGVKQTAQNVEDQIKRTLQTQLSKLDFVSREEYEIQQKMLLKMRARLEQLTRDLDAIKEKSD